MNPLMLTPTLQEELLFLPRRETGGGEVCLRDLQRVTAVRDSEQQRVLRELQ
jgi:hypothetical protein